MPLLISFFSTFLSFLSPLLCVTALERKSRNRISFSSLNVQQTATPFFATLSHQADNQSNYISLSLVATDIRRNILYSRLQLDILFSTTTFHLCPCSSFHPSLMLVVSVDLRSPFLKRTFDKHSQVFRVTHEPSALDVVLTFG